MQKARLSCSRCQRNSSVAMRFNLEMRFEGAVSRGAALLCKRLSRSSSVQNHFDVFRIIPQAGGYFRPKTSSGDEALFGERFEW